MSYIPDCRAKYERDVIAPFRNEKSREDIPAEIINPYWYGLLQGGDKSFLQGFDWNTNMVINNMFDNLDVFAEHFERLGVSLEDIDTNIIDGAVDTYNETMPDIKDDRKVKWYNEYTDEELEEMTPATKMILAMKYMLNDYIEIRRDEIVSAMIENMPEDEHMGALREAAGIKH